MDKDQYILITGASSGMGEATAKLLSESRNLILNGRDEARLAAVGEACAQKGSNVVLFPFDLEHADTVGSALTAFLKEKKTPGGGFCAFCGHDGSIAHLKNKILSWPSSDERQLFFSY